MRRVVVLCALAGLALGGFSLASAAVRDAPPGATALCVDGTYSYSQTRSGTCSHHGGVAEWLTPSPATTPTTTAPVTTSAPTPITTTTSASTTTTTSSPTTTTTPAGSTAPAFQPSGYLGGFTNGASYQAYTLCFPSYGSTLASGTLTWGDGTTTNVGSGVSGLAHAYTYGGSYTIALLCVDSAGYTWTQSLSATVTGPAMPVVPTTTTQVTTTSASPGSSRPPGATAQCKDGTYSFSQTRSGTCSHHGGVATWLAGAPSGGSSSTTPSGGSSTNSGGSSSSSSTGSVALGSTVLLSSRTKTSGCTLGAEPDRSCSPGAYYSGLTKAVLCSSSFHTSSIRNVTESEKHAVEEEYGLPPVSYGSTLEIDHIVSLELGGSNDIANLFPERASPAPGYHAKDTLENRLHDMVCTGQISLSAAQSRIAADWEKLYTDVFGNAPSR